MTECSVPSWATLVRAANPGPMTLDGTNTWVLRASGASGCVVIDPGPLDQSHLDAVAAFGPVDLILLTHGHADHAEGAHRLQGETGAPMAAVDPAYVVAEQPLRNAVLIDVAGLTIRVLRTPGHTSDSVCFVVGDHTEPAVLTGDTILGRGSTVVAAPDGVLADYLESLERLRELGPMPVLPGHGPVRGDVVAAASGYLRHREERLAQVRDAVAGGATTVEEVLRLVYADVDRALWPAAELSVRAQLTYLRS